MISDTPIEVIMDANPSLDNPFEPEDIARGFGFTEQEIAMMKMYMAEGFNLSYIYLSDYIITKYLTNERGKDRYAHFYDQILRKSFSQDVDYITVEYDHPVVQAAFAFGMPDEEKSSLNLESFGKRVGNKKYYLVTGMCFKKLLMKANTAAGEAHCDYYLKLEQVLALFLRYISEVSHRKQQQEMQKQLEARDRLLLQQQEDMKATIEAERQRLEREHKEKWKRRQEIAMRVPTVVPNPGYIYLMRSRDRDGAVKIGKSNDTVRRTREFSTADPSIECCRQWQVRDMSTAERVVHETMARYRVNKKREWFYDYDGVESDIDTILRFFLTDIEDRTARVYERLESVATLPSFEDDDNIDDTNAPRSRSRSRGRSPAPVPADTINNPPKPPAKKKHPMPGNIPLWSKGKIDGHISREIWDRANDIVDDILKDDPKGVRREETINVILGLVANAPIGTVNIYHGVPSPS